jgi:hypothetical protein
MPVSLNGSLVSQIYSSAATNFHEGKGGVGTDLAFRGFWGGGGSAASDRSDPGSSVFGGGGGGASNHAGAQSIFGGNGGGNGVAAQVPGGGGACVKTSNANGLDGASGRVIVTVW